MADPPQRKMTVEEFFTWCDGQEGRWELVDGVPRPVFPMEQLPGEPYAMAGPTRRHQKLQTNAYDLVRRHVRPPCWSETTFGVRVGALGTREPDIVSSCEQLPDDERVAVAPLLVIEVISPSTEATDRTAKLDEYKGLPSMREIWLVASARRWVQVWRRAKDGRWLGEDVIGAGGFASAVLAAEVGLAELYAGVEVEGA